MEGLGPKLPLKYSSVDGPYGMIKDYKTMLMQNLKMLVLTSPGERVMDPSFGVGVRNYLFYNDFLALQSQLQNSIHQQVSRYMPMIELNNIDISNNAGNEEYVSVNITYTVPDINLQDVLSLTIN